MYEVSDFDPSVLGAGKKMRGPGVKSAERLAIEGLVPGKMVRFPKESALRNSVGAWASTVGKQNGIKISVASVGDDWLVYAEKTQ